MARIHRKHFIAAVEAGIAACPIFKDPRMDGLRSALVRHAGWQSETAIGTFRTSDDDSTYCPLGYAGLVYVSDNGSVGSKYTDNTSYPLVSFADFQEFWTTFDAAARPHVTSWDGDPSVPVRIIEP